MYAVNVQSVSKRYRLYEKPVDRLKEVLFRRQYHQVFSALENVSFDIQPHESLGVIGDNGSGKSTLLKMLAGTLLPSEGQIDISGRVAALLELGAGFHPEFSGRQNIYLNATLLGLKYEEIQAIEDDIIGFAELRDFIDRPVKTYSSGMYIRLAFSIATSVDPDVLIIDEALSVGDLHFQKKCVDRIMNFREMDKTIVLCSHSMYLVSELCNRAIWLHKGKIQDSGAPDDVIMAYDNWCQKKQIEHQENQVKPTHRPPVRVKRIRVVNNEGIEIESTGFGDDMSVVLDMESQYPISCHIGVGIDAASGGKHIFGITSKADAHPPVHVNGRKTVTVKFAGVNLFGFFRAFVYILDEYAVHVYDYQVSREFEIKKHREVYGWMFMEHQWQF